MVAGISPLNRTLNLIPRRAEQRQVDQLRETFVDSGVAAALESIDHQVIYGRRGTGKTHALRYLETEVRSSGNAAVYIDLRTIGSPDGLFSEGDISPNERAARLLVDLLGVVNEALLEIAVNDEELLANQAFLNWLDGLSDAIGSIRIDGQLTAESEDESLQGTERQRSVSGKLGKQPMLGGAAANSTATQNRGLNREARQGTERIDLNFGEVTRTLRGVAESLRSQRLWLLLDEWSSVPADSQPLLGEFLVRCVLPLQLFTVKIAAIEQQTNFREERPGRGFIGIELGADVSANVNLDEYMVFEQDPARARAFFLGLLFKHVSSVAEGSVGVHREADLLRQGFTDKRAFDELVRAAEGVPRDAINIVAKAAFRAGESKISVPDIRVAARAWFQADKEAALRSRADAQRLLNWIIDKVIREKRSRGFLVNQRASAAPLLLPLFDARVLHLVRRGYSAQDEPGERYDVWVIDYGAYVDLIQTKSAPSGQLPGQSDGGAVDVPTQDLRAIRRAILDLEQFQSARTADIRQDVAD